MNWCPKCESPERGIMLLAPVQVSRTEYDFKYWPHCQWCETRMTCLCVDCQKAPATHDDYCKPCAVKNFEPGEMEAFDEPARRDMAAPVRPLIRET